MVDSRNGGTMTPRGQRIGIWIITVVMAFGVVGSFLVMILSTSNQAEDAKKQQAMIEEYQKDLKKKEAEAKIHYEVLAPFKTVPSQFDPQTIGDKVATRDLKVGDGADIGEKDTYQAYYVGWNPDGKVFDSSYNEDQTNLDANKLINTAQSTLIKGWNEGVIGMKVGGVREISMPAADAYGKAGQGDDIPPNTPLKFIVYVVKKN